MVSIVSNIGNNIDSINGTFTRTFIIQLVDIQTTSTIGSKLVSKLIDGDSLRRLSDERFDSDVNKAFAGGVQNNKEKDDIPEINFE